MSTTSSEGVVSKEDVKKQLFNTTQHEDDDSTREYSEEGSESSSSEASLLQQTTRFGTVTAVTKNKNNVKKKKKKKNSLVSSPSKATTEGRDGKKGKSNKKKKKNADKGNPDQDSDQTEDEEQEKLTKTRPRKKMTKEQKNIRKKEKEKHRKAKSKRREQVKAQNAKKKEGEPLEEEVSSDTESSSSAETIDDVEQMVQICKPEILPNDTESNIVIQPNLWKPKDLTSHQLMQASMKKETKAINNDDEAKSSNQSDEDSDSQHEMNKQVGKKDKEEHVQNKLKQLQKAAEMVKRAAQDHILEQVNKRGHLQDGMYMEQYPPMASWARSTADSRWLRECISDIAQNPGPIPLKSKRIGVEFLPQEGELQRDAKLHGIKDNTGLLTINVKKLRFFLHPAFSREDFLATQLQLRYRDYRSRFTSSSLRNLCQKLTYFYREFISSSAAKVQNGEAISDATKMAALQTVLALAQEAHEIRIIGREVYSLWKQVKLERVKSGFQLTSPKIIVQRVALYPVPVVEKMIAWSTECVKNSLKQAEASNDKSLHVSALALKKRMDRAFIQLNHNISESGKQVKRKKKDKKGKKDKSSKNKAAANDFLFTLINDEDSISGEMSVPPHERQRRHLALSWQVGFRLVINNEPVTCLGPAKMKWPSFCCDFKSVTSSEAISADNRTNKSIKPATVTLKVRRQPQSIELEVWEYSSAKQPIRQIGKFPVKLPGEELDYLSNNDYDARGISQHSVPELRTVSQFTANMPMDGVDSFASHTSDGSNEAKNPDESGHVNANLQRQWKTQKCIRGEVVVETKWQTPPQDQESDAVFLPRTAPTENSRIIAQDICMADNYARGSGILSVPEFARERDFCLAVLDGPAPPLNPNDPGNCDLLHLENLAIANSKLDFFNIKEFPRHLRLPRLKPKEDAAAESSGAQISQRHQLLLLRKEKGSTHLVNNHPIPATEVGVTSQKNLLKTLDEDEMHKDSMKMDVDDERETIAYASFEDVENRHKKVTSFFENVQAKVMKLQYVSAVGQTDEMIHEEMLPGFFAPAPGSFSIGDMVAPKRRLKPRRQERATENINITKTEVFVQIASARNVPIRSKAADRLRAQGTKRRNASYSAGGSAIANAGEYNSEERVAPYVSVRFQKQCNETDPQEGPNPRWGQSFSFNVNFPVETEITIERLKEIRDEVHIDLFDHIEKNAEIDSRLTSVEAVRIERRFLGSFVVPFQTILINKRIEGVFEIDIPVPLLGYELEPLTRRIDEDEDSDDNETSKNVKEGHSESQLIREQRKRTAANDAKRTQIRLMMTLDPPPPSVYSGLRDVDEPTAISNSASFQKKFVFFAKTLQHDLGTSNANVIQAGRNISLTAVTVTGELAIICQFITPQKPPPFSYVSLSNDASQNVDQALEMSPFPQKSRRALAHYTALIPFIDDSMLFNKNDVWTSSSDLLYLRAGDWEEHAILLCNYFLHMNTKVDNGKPETYCCCGRAVPDGDVIFVLHRDQEDEAFTVWNPRNGHSYSAASAYSPLKSISVLFNNENAWINIGPMVDLTEQSFKISDRKIWHPLQADSLTEDQEGETREELLDKSDALLIEKLPSLQNGSPRYDTTGLTRKLAVDLKQAILHRVEICMRNWRKATSRTIFSSVVSEKLGSFLERLEEARLSPTQEEAEKLIPSKEELEAIGGRSKQLFAVPIHISLMDIMQVEKAVHRTQIFTIDDPRVEFGKAAQPFMYPGRITSLWIYVAAILPRSI